MTQSRGPSFSRALRAATAAMLAAASVVVAPVAQIVQPAAVEAAGSFVDSHFADFPVWTGLDHPTTVRFASDERAFVAEKGGKVFEYDSVNSSARTQVIDISAHVHNYWDRGLLGLALDPDFLNGSPYLYLFYVDSTNVAPNAGVGGVPATWESGYNDGCPSPPNSTTDGCTVKSRLDRYTVNTTTNVADPNSVVHMLNDWCQQFPSHSGGGLAFGSDGDLYVSGGDGASFGGMDFGNWGGSLPSYANPVTPANPCGDPVDITSAPGDPTTFDPTDSEGGMLRAQDVRTTGDPTGLDGAVIRINPNSATGAAASDNPLIGAAGADANAKRIVAHGFRNPYRMTFRPGASSPDLYIGDVGNSTWEEINRLPVSTSSKTVTTLPNYGWPCYEGDNAGSAQQGAFANLNTNMCTNLYNQANAVTAPLFSYQHSAALDSSGRCPQGAGGSSTTGLAFYEGPTDGNTAYPPKYDGALFFVDYARNCIGAILAGSNGVPVKTTQEVIGQNVSQPVDLTTGPGGDLYYVDHGGGRVMRIRYLEAPVAQATVTPAHSIAPVDVTLDGSSSIEPNAGYVINQWSWDVDNNGTYDYVDSVPTQVWHVSTPGIYTVKLKVTSTSGQTDTTTVSVDTQDEPPVPTIDSPANCGNPPPGCWSVGDTINFSGHATDLEDAGGNNLPASKLHWNLIIEHCTGGNPQACHEHNIQSFTGDHGSFQAPDHEYPSHLRLKLTVTDSNGAVASTYIELYPNTVDLNLASTPTGASIAVDSQIAAAPWTATVIKGGTATLSASLTRTVSGQRYRFSTWADSHVRVRNVAATADKSFAATYVPDAPDTCSSATPSAKDTWLHERSSGNSDVDWFEFKIAKKQKVTIRVTDQPISLTAVLYKGCSTQLASANGPGRSDSVITRTLSSGTYRVKVTAPGNGWSASQYQIRFKRR